MTFLISTLAFIVAIGLLVTVHEYGHFLMARLLRVPVLRFSIGFGKPLLRRQSRSSETEFVLSALPLGGYVKMLDERDPDFPKGREAEAFNRQAAWKRALILLGGPAFNFLFAILAYWAIFLNGVPGIAPIIGNVVAGSPAAMADVREGDRIESINGESVATWQASSLALLDGLLDDAPLVLELDRDGRHVEASLRVEDAHPLTEPGALLPGLGLSQWWPRPVIAAVPPDGPAFAAGLQAGDEILALGGERITGGTSQFSDLVQEYPGEEVAIRVLRDGEAREFQVVPQRVEDDKGPPVRVGVELTYEREQVERLRAFEQSGPVEAIPRAFGKTWEISALTLRVLGRMVIGDVSLKNISGPINIASYAGQSASIGILPFLTFLAVISISLGIINLLPVPMLDGGQLLFLVFEWMKGAPLSPAAEAIGQRVGLLMLAGFMSLAFYNDIARLLGHGG